MNISESDRHTIRDQREAECIRIQWKRLPVIDGTERVNLLGAKRAYPLTSDEFRASDARDRIAFGIARAKRDKAAS